MNTEKEIREDYFWWLYNCVCERATSKRMTYVNLFRYLHNKEFIWSLPMDENRADDGMEMRYRFSIDLYYNGKDYSFPTEDEDCYVKYLDGPCSVLEMLIGLVTRMEENILYDPRYGDRSKQWFWTLIKNLGLGTMNDYNFNLEKVVFIVNRFLNREYEPNGKGGLFVIKGCKDDLRDVEIWYQANWYISSIS